VQLRRQTGGAGLNGPNEETQLAPAQAWSERRTGYKEGLVKSPKLLWRGKRPSAAIG
jgi:hypothetical protein